MYGFTSTYPTLSKSRLIKTLRRQKLFFQTYTYFIYEPDIIVIKWLKNRTGNISISQKWFVIIWRNIYIYFFFPWNTADIDKTSRFDKLWKIKTITNRTFGILIQVRRNDSSSGTIRLLWDQKVDRRMQGLPPLWCKKIFDRRDFTYCDSEQNHEADDRGTR